MPTSQNNWTALLLVPLAEMVNRAELLFSASTVTLPLYTTQYFSTIALYESASVFPSCNLL